MRLSYPATLKTYDNGQVGVSFSDVPEAITAGATPCDALQHAEDALVVALTSYVDDRRPIPAPSVAQPDQVLVDLPPLVAMKLAVHQEMIVRNMTQRQLAELIGCDERQVRRVLDLDHESKISQIETALTALGLRVSVEVDPMPFPSAFVR